MMATYGKTIVVALLLAAGNAVAGEVITVVERANTDAVTDLGAKGDSVGDLLTFANPVFDKQNKNQVGTDQGYCVRTVAGKAWECAWSMSLKDGAITVAGPFLDAGDSVLAITGGTGRYAAARGQMKLHARNAKGTEYDFVYELQ
jgi:allene oxide cyclase